MSDTPKISIITPSLNQGQYLERTILSVLNQNYPNLEYIIIDGGSMDNSLDIINKHKDKLTYWVSEKDNGQAEAINKGLKLCTGDIIGWINSDDMLAEGSLNKIASVYSHSFNWLTAECTIIDQADNYLDRITPEIPTTNFDWLNLFVRGFSYSIAQPSTFWSAQVLKSVGLLNEKLHYSFDHEYFYRIFRKYGKPIVLSDCLSLFRVHNKSKTDTQSDKFKEENRLIGKKHIGDSKLFKQYLYLWLNYYRFRF